MAYNELLAAAKVDLEDYFRFEPVKKVTAGQGGDQPAVEGVRVVSTHIAEVRRSI